MGPSIYGMQHIWSLTRRNHRDEQRRIAVYFCKFLAPDHNTSLKAPMISWDHKVVRKTPRKSLKLETFHRLQNEKTAFAYIQQFDAAFVEGNSPRLRSNFSFEGGALTWWLTLLVQGQASTTWLGFKSFVALWLTPSFEANIVYAWNILRLRKSKTLFDYN
ncbi:hypothetical protein L7F22_002736 [Adiantum nelumboides]|nr:hypothetical protein [Adiantum nelumboides]